MVRFTERTPLMDFWKRHKDHSVCSAPDTLQTSGRISQRKRKVVGSWAILAGVVLATRVAVATPYVVPSGSMQPTLLIGDRMIAQPLAYGFSTANLPLGNYLPGTGRVFARLPHRGDIVVFRNPAHPADTFVKRVIGLPGDTLSLHAGRVTLNGHELPWAYDGLSLEELSDGRKVPAVRYTETLPGGFRHPLLKTTTTGPLDTIPRVTVPAGHLFVMGDNRDNSADSRLDQANGGVGLLPVWNLQGKAIVIAASRDTKAPAGTVSEALRSIRFERFFSWVK